MIKYGVPIKGIKSTWKEKSEGPDFHVIKALFFYNT